MPLSRLQIAVVGGGSIGSTFAFQLARVGRHDARWSRGQVPPVSTNYNATAPW